LATADAVFTASIAVKLRDAGVRATTFVGYEGLQAETKLQAVVGEGDLLLPRAGLGDKVVLVAETTPFYAQGGGQVGDRGLLRTPTGEAQIATTTVLDGIYLHQATVRHGHVEPGQACTLAVDEAARRATERNHTATHLLHAALKKVLGDHVSQAGSEVAPERLRFDYTQPEKPTAEQLQRVEDEVNAQVLLATDVRAQVQPLAAARAAGFMALFGEKYGDQVRTLQVGEFSRELCGGTHVRNSGNIGAFRITAETAVAAGTRRLEAVTGLVALELARQERVQLQTLATNLKVPVAKVGDRVRELADELKQSRRDLEKARAPDLDVELAKLLAVTTQKDGVHSFVYERPGLQPKDAQDLLRRALKASEPLVGVLLSAIGDEVHVAVAVSPALHERLRAGDLVKSLAALLGGGGGGRPEFAQGKGKDASRLAEARGAAVAALRTAGVCD
jgi:alanyl-tRNA synthetase